MSSNVLISFEKLLQSQVQILIDVCKKIVSNNKLQTSHLLMMMKMTN